MNLAPDDHPAEQLAASVLSGELAIDDPALQAAFAADPGLRQRLLELLDLRAELDQTSGEAWRDALARPEPWPGADAAMRTVVERELGPSPPKAHADGSRRRWWPWLAAAAALLVGWYLWRPDTQQLPVAPNDLPLDAGDVRFEPRGRTSAAELLEHGFRWPGSFASTARFEVTVRTADGVVLRKGDLREARWTPSAEDVAKLPAQCEWLVLVVQLGKRQSLGPVRIEIAR